VTIAAGFQVLKERDLVPGLFDSFVCRHDRAERFASVQLVRVLYLFGGHARFESFQRKAGVLDKAFEVAAVRYKLHIEPMVAIVLSCHGSGDL
jgi:hypothetical protein